MGSLPFFFFTSIACVLSIMAASTWQFLIQIHLGVKGKSNFLSAFQMLSKQSVQTQLIQVEFKIYSS